MPSDGFTASSSGPWRPSKGPFHVTGNQKVEYAMARLTNLMLMRAMGEQVSDALTYNDMTNED